MTEPRPTVPPLKGPSPLTLAFLALTGVDAVALALFYRYPRGFGNDPMGNGMMHAADNLMLALIGILIGIDALLFLALYTGLRNWYCGVICIGILSVLTLWLLIGRFA